MMVPITCFKRKYSAIASIKTAARFFTSRSVRRRWRSGWIRTGEQLQSVSFLSDGEILEVTAEDGLICGAYETRTDRKRGEIGVCAEGMGVMEIFQII